MGLNDTSLDVDSKESQKNRAYVPRNFSSGSFYALGAW